ncbi:nicotinate-nucleotide adenylyltransferase [Motilimonas pumila]|uniref:Probable nicotinate-nucleotide adenylyltransferase n=1 Tax=Motilimonas pumila TaxID=2303987 RepID=A0A418YJS2_9GAMM|nr:nicotinate-nucleotide adenylyltransferase [Motilimonas pumila]RJG51232.1 nicotinate-nucleotide adenylyltransferase [Motilimonas pumila]
MRQAQSIIAFLGGTFDPIHFGHLRLATEVQQALDAQVMLLPNQTPPHKAQQQVSFAHRCNMVELAIAAHPELTLSTLEAQLPQPNYSVQTLQHLRQHQPQAAIVFVIGMDSLLNIQSWHRWQELLAYCHLLVCRRPGCNTDYPAPLAQFLAQHESTDIEPLLRTRNGRIFFLESTELEISSSHIRQQIIQGQSPRYLLPDNVIEYIKQNKLYLNLEA